VLVLLVLSVALTVAPVHAGVSPFWRELGGSATGGGVSRTAAPKDLFDTSVAVDAGGQPIVVYAEIPTANGTQGPIIVKRWNGTAFQTLGTLVGPGYLPQVRVSASGNIFIAWLHDDANGNSEIRLRMFDGTSFVELGGSDAAGGITGTNPGITFPFGLAIGADGRPVVAFLAAAQTGIVEVTSTPAVAQETRQVYVRHWNGTAWEFLGGDFSGTDGFAGGGASSALSFDSITAGGSVLHEADGPALTFDSSGAPVVAFVYVTQLPDGLIENTDVYVTRWNGSAWQAVGSPVPSTDDAAGLGGAGGVSGSETTSLNPSIAAAPDGTLALSWEEASPDDTALYVWVRVWTGAAWAELDGSATDSGITDPFTHNGVPQIAVGPDSRPIVAWNALTPGSPAPQIWVKRYDGGTWTEPAFHSAADAGISDAVQEAFAPALALTPSGGSATAGVPTVAWVDARAGSAPSQVFLRQLFSGPAFTLTVNVGEGGMVTSNPIGVECATGLCTADFPTGTVVRLTATPDPGGAFAGWVGACSGTAACLVTLNANQTVTASFKSFRVRAAVSVPAGVVAQGAVGTVIGDGVSCDIDNTAACFADLLQGTHVVLRATPQPANRFLNWSTGPCAGRTNSTCEFTVAGNTTSTALFRGVTGVRVAKTGNGSGTVSGTGISCGADCFQELFSGTTVTLTPTATTGTTFRGWSGDACDGKATGACTFVVGGNRSLTMANQSITATFQLNVLKLAVTQRSNGTVVSDPLPGGGLDCGTSTNVCQGLYDFNTPVVLRATAAPGTVFTAWTGVACLFGGASNRSCEFKLTANTTATPTFRPRTQVTVTRTGNGAGAVSGPGISCGATCSAPEFDGRLVTLTVAPTTGSRFAGWGDACAFRGMNTSCAFVPTGDNQSVTAAFQLIPYTLTVTSRASGNVVSLDALPDPIDCGSGGVGKCSATVNFGTPVRLQARPIAGSTFTSWTGCTSVLGTNCSFTMTANRTVTPAYRDISSVSLTKTGMGTVTSAPAGISCGTDCTESYVAGTSVTLSATPGTGSAFASWSGACAGQGNPCTVSVTADTSATATFGTALWIVLTLPGGSRTSSSISRAVRSPTATCAVTRFAVSRLSARCRRFTGGTPSWYTPTTGVCGSASAARNAYWPDHGLARFTCRTSGASALNART